MKGQSSSSPGLEFSCGAPCVDAWSHQLFNTCADLSRASPRSLGSSVRLPIAYPFTGTFLFNPIAGFYSRQAPKTCSRAAFTTSGPPNRTITCTGILNKHQRRANPCFGRRVVLTRLHSQQKGDFSTTLPLETSVISQERCSFDNVKHWR